MKETVGIGIIGTGFAKTVQIPSFLAAGHAGVVSIASGSIENAESAARQFSIGHFTDDWRETVQNDAVDLVCITTPPDLHKDMTLLALEHGKHVLCEKPMALNVAEAEEMTSAAKAAGVLVLIDHELRFQPGRQLAFHMIRDGVIGRIRHARYTFEASHRGDPAVAWNWWSDADRGGGALGAINSHIIDSFNWFLGSEINEVYCQLQTNIKERPDPDGRLRPVSSDDQANMLLRFADGETTSDATGLVSVSMTDGTGYKNRIEFFGDKGAMQIDYRGAIKISERGETEWTDVDTDLGEPLEGVGDTGFSRGFLQFASRIIEAIRSGAGSVEMAATFDDGLKVQRVLDAARRSNEGGCAVSL
ncbi:MAG: Gfo/Idh/MocA family oxidoreductase [Acidobacteriota bacterium]